MNKEKITERVMFALGERLTRIKQMHSAEHTNEAEFVDGIKSFFAAQRELEKAFLEFLAVGSPIEFLKIQLFFHNFVKNVALDDDKEVMIFKKETKQ